MFRQLTTVGTFTANTSGARVGVKREALHRHIVAQSADTRYRHAVQPSVYRRDPAATVAALAATGPK